MRKITLDDIDGLDMLERELSHSIKIYGAEEFIKKYTEKLNKNEFKENEYYENLVLAVVNIKRHDLGLGKLRTNIKPLKQFVWARYNYIGEKIPLKTLIKLPKLYTKAIPEFRERGFLYRELYVKVGDTRIIKEREKTVKMTLAEKLETMKYNKKQKRGQVRVW